MPQIEPADLDCLIAANYGPGYVTWKLPDARDSAISALLTKALANGQVEDLADVLSWREADVLGAFSQRMAELAVRARDPGHLKNSILAIGLAGKKSRDPRDEMMVAALPWHSAKLLGLDPFAEFHAIAEAALPAAEFLLTWATWPPENQTLDVMLFQESSDEDGFRYQYIG